MAKKDYIYQVARIRAKELTLLSSAFIKQLLSVKTVEECLKLLEEKSWGAEGAENIEELLRGEREKTWELMREMVEDMSVFDVFLYNNDYHNLKAAMKDALIEGEPTGIYLAEGVAKKAYDILLLTGDSQESDVIIDRAALNDIYDAANQSSNEFLRMYGEVIVACADIKIAIRAVRTGKDMHFLKGALAKCDSLNIDLLAKAATDSEKAIADYLEITAYKEAVPALLKSISTFEVWCDNYLIKAMKSQLSEPFEIGPLAAYILARENEIKTVRLILSGKQNDLPDEVIHERVREMYV